MLEGSTPSYDQENIRGIITRLYEQRETDAANRICNIYGSRNMDFLRDLYEEHNRLCCGTAIRHDGATIECPH
jgi:hypothetical protein